MYEIKPDDERSNEANGIDLTKNSEKPNILMYVNGRFHRSRDFPWIIDSTINFINHRNEYKLDVMLNLTFLPEGNLCISNRFKLIMMMMMSMTTTGVDDDDADDNDDNNNTSLNFNKNKCLD